MGGIKCVPSGSTSGSEHEIPIPRLTKVPPGKAVGELGVIPLQTYQKSQGGLSNVIVEDLTDIVKKTDQLNPFDTLWLAAKWLNIKCVPEWKGFMHSITKGIQSEKTKVILLFHSSILPHLTKTQFTQHCSMLPACAKKLIRNMRL